MPVRELDACFFVDEPPEIEFRAGLFHVTQVVGNYRFTRVMQPNTFKRTVRRGARLIAEFDKNPGADILPFTRAIDAGH